jgi:VIT1/CCC1 family predicted Fe2+/Mn2+ transporter
VIARNERVLDPIERMSEVLFGLIMVLSFTGSISVASDGREEVGSVLIGAIGCNLAWGLIDAVMYLMMLLIERGRTLAVGQAVRASTDAAQGSQLLAESLPEPLDTLFDAPALERARAKLVAQPALPARPRLTGRDWKAAFGVFLLVFLSTFPVAVPFLLIPKWIPTLELGMRISNGVAIAMLYAAGHILGKHAGLNAFKTGLVMVLIGVVLVAVTIALGG